MKIPRTLTLILFIILMLSACGSPAATETAPSATPVPSDTPVPTSTDKPMPPTATIQPSPTIAPLLFRDDFDGGMAEGWNWTRENKKTWSLTNNPGWLEIVANPGNLGNGNLDNILMRAVPEGNFEIETKVLFKPVGDYQLAGLLIYESASNFIQFGRAFCDAPNFCVKDGFYVDLMTDGNMDGENLSTAAKGSEIAVLRLRREGNKYTAYASQGDEEWQLIGEKTSDMEPIFIGLLAGQAFSAPQPAQFDYFLVNRLP